jgi:hypothetical protein
MIWGIPNLKGGIVNRKPFHMMFCILFSIAMLTGVCNQVRVHRKNNQAEDPLISKTKEIK